MRTFLAALLSVPALFLGAAPAQALSCVGPELVIKDAEVVFVGHVVDSDRGRLLVEVDEVWKGDRVEKRLWLAVDLVEWTSWGDGSSTLPDDIEESSPRVFAPGDGAVNACSMWPMAPELREYRPDTTTSPVADGAAGNAGEAAVDDPRAEAAAPGRDLTAYAAGGGAVVLLVAVAGWWLRRSRARG